MWPRQLWICQLSIKCQAKGLCGAEAKTSADLTGLRSPPLHTSALISRMFRKFGDSLRNNESRHLRPGARSIYLATAGTNGFAFSVNQTSHFVQESNSISGICVSIVSRQIWPNDSLLKVLVSGKFYYNLKQQIAAVLKKMLSFILKIEKNKPYILLL